MSITTQIHPSSHLFRQILLAVLVLQAAVTDLRTGNIRNGPLLALSVCCVLSQAGRDGAALVPASLARALLPYVLFYPLWRLGSIGGGDVKLLMAIAVFYPLRRFLSCAALGFVMAGGICLVRAVRRGGMRGGGIRLSLPLGAAALVYAGGVL